MSPEEWSALGQMVAGVATALTFAVAVVAAVYARRQVNEARRTREDQTRPYIVVDAEISQASRIHIDLVIRNVGATAARNVRLEFTPPLETSMNDLDLTDSVLINEGVKTMPPGREIRALMDQGPSRLKAKLPNRYDVIVRYEDLKGRAQPELRFVLDLEYLYGITTLGVKTTHDAARALEGIYRILDKSQERGRMAVGVTNLDARNERERGERAWTGRWPRHNDYTHEALVAFGSSPYRRWMVKLLRSAWLKMKALRSAPPAT